MNSNIFIGQIFTMVCRLDNPEESGLLELDGRNLTKTEYPDLYNLFAKCPDNEIKKLIINDNDFKLPNYTARYLRNHGVANSSNNGGGQPGLMYGDAIRNIVGSQSRLSAPFSMDDNQVSGVYKISARGLNVVGRDSDNYGVRVEFDAARVVPTASENRVFTANVVYYIKAK